MVPSVGRTDRIFRTCLGAGVGVIVGTGEAVAVGDAVAVGGAVAVGDAVAVGVEAAAGTGLGVSGTAVRVGSGTGSAAVPGWNDKAKVLSVSSSVLFWNDTVSAWET